MVTFQEENDEPVDQKPKSKVKEFGHGRDEVEIEFITDKDDEDSISGLSWSIGKLWDAESMMDVWETNSQATVEKSPEFFIESLYRTEIKNDHDQVMVEDDDDSTTDSGKISDRQTLLDEDRALLRQSPRIKSRAEAEAAARPIEELELGTTKDPDGRRRLLRLQRNKEGAVAIDEEEETNVENIHIGKEITCMGAGIGGGFQHTTEHMVKKYNQVMHGTQPKEWAKEVIKEYWRMVTNKVWKPILRTKDMRTITTTWAMKQKASGDK